MKDYDITKLPFTSISRENWEMLVELDKDALYDVMQRIGNYVLTGERCNCDDTQSTLSKIVCNQVISVIDRKGEAYCKTTSNLKPREKKETKTEIAQEPVVKETDEDALFDDVLSDPAMDNSTLIGNISYFKGRKREELNNLYLKLDKKYTPDELIKKLQERYLYKLNN